MGKYTLDAISIQGIGSYISKSRLELKPLTVLCGKNGAGKSTWLKAIRILKESLSANRLPYGFYAVDWTQNDIQIMNACYHLGSTDHTDTISTGYENSSGFPGGIEIEFHRNATGAFTLEEIDLIKDSLPLLFEEEKSSGTRYKITLAHPTHYLDHEPTPHLKHIIRLEINDKHVLELTGERDPLQRFEVGHLRPRRSKPYHFRLTTSFLKLVTKSSELSLPDCMISAGTIQDLINLKLQDVSQGDYGAIVDKLLVFFERRLIQLLTAVLGSFNIIDAIRLPHLEVEVEGKENRRNSIVAPDGANAWSVAIRHERIKMGEIQSFRFTEKECEAIAHVLSYEEICNRFPKIEWIFSRLHEVQQKILRNVASSPRMVDYSEVTKWLDKLLEDRSLWNPSLWEITYSHPDPGPSDPPEYTEISNSHIAELVGEDVSQLSDIEVRELNYFLVLYSLQELDRNFEFSNECCSFREYLSWWLQHLFEVDYRDLRSSGSVNLPETLSEKLGERHSHARLNRPTFFRNDNTGYSVQNWSLAKLHSPCFGDARLGGFQPPRQFSSAFHQIFPVVVQLGLMDRSDTLAIENPEVHLHPSLQLRVMEMLLDHAKSGRRILVETHSDLLLRRVIRAILQEEISQQAVAIYCVDLNEKHETKVNGRPSVFKGSTVAPIVVNENGQIANWPSGFLDEDMFESQRLMDVMYGCKSEDTSDD